MLSILCTLPAYVHSQQSKNEQLGNCIAGNHKKYKGLKQISKAKRKFAFTLKYSFFQTDKQKQRLRNKCSALFLRLNGKSSVLLNITGNNVGLAFVIPSYFANIAVLQSVIVSLNSASVMLCCCHCCSLGTGTPECSLVPTSDPSLGRTVFGGPTYPPRHFGKSALNSGHVFLLLASNHTNKKQHIV